MRTVIHGAMLWNSQNGRNKGGKKGDIEDHHGDKCSEGACVCSNVQLTVKLRDVGRDVC